MPRTLLSWSSGKDSAWTLHLLRQQSEYELVGLLTTFNGEANRVAMHGVRRELVQAQARAANLPLWDVDLPSPCSNDDYERIMREVCAKAVREGIACIAFGDLFLRDVRAYREKQLEGSGLQPIFPVWNIPTPTLARQMLDGGLRARLTCIDTEALSDAFAGREFDHQLLADLPVTVDPCGENGEFHSCVYAGPMFEHELAIEAGDIVQRDRFIFADVKLVPNTNKSTTSLSS